MAPHTIAVVNGTSRTFKHLVPQALAQGHKVRAIVRSASRFLAQTKKHDDLSAHEWTDFSDLTTLATILDGVDVVYVALCASAKGLLEPTYLNEDAVISIGTVLHSTTPPGTRSSTKVVILSSYAIRPGEPARALSEALLGNQFNDLRRAQSYLLKQSGWLDVVYIAPGMLLDSEESDSAVTEQVRLVEVGHPEGVISYARLAAAMQVAAADGKWSGKFVIPIATTTKVPVGLKYMHSALGTIGVAFQYGVLPWVLKRVGLGLVGAGLGYVLGIREQGVWLAQRFGINLRK